MISASGCAPLLRNGIVAGSYSVMAGLESGVGFRYT